MSGSLLEKREIQTSSAPSEDLANMRSFLQHIEQELDIALQPIVHISDGRVHAYEALARNYSDFGVQSPSDLYEIASHFDCVLELETALWEKACRQFSGLDEVERLHLFLNIDGRSIEIAGSLLVDSVIEVARTFNIRPGQITLELSEASDVAIVQKMADVRLYAKRKSLGFAIDDFGKGYSQLKCLHELEPDMVKIDRFFIDGIDTSARKHLLVSSIVQLAHRLGMRVVTEGIETEEELNACQALKADFAQGYFIGQPLLDRSEINLITNAPPKGTTGDKSDMGDLDTLNALERLPTATVTDKAEDILQKFKDNALLRVIPVVNDEQEPVGIICEEDLRPYLYNPYGHMLLRNNGIYDVVSRFVKKVPISDYRTSLSQLVPTGAISAADCIVITKNGQYLGVVSTQTLLRVANADRVKQAEDQNPLTRLPGNRAIQEHILAQSKRSEFDRFFYYFDFDAFKPFNDLYGFSAGDRVIQLFGDLLRTKLGSIGAFLGHVGGDDFFVGLHDIAVQDAVKVAADIRSEFSAAALGFYSRKDQDRGHYVSTDRSGKQAKHDLLSCSVGIAHLSPRQSIESLGSFGAAVSQIKKEAKGAPHGVVVRDMNGLAGVSPVGLLQANLQSISA